MKSLIILLCLVGPVLAFAASSSPVDPEIGKSVCLKREYTDDHMREVPKQMLSSLYVLVTKSKKSFEDGTRSVYTGAEVIGKHNGQYYANWEPYCQAKAGGILSCAVECDGGSFDLIPRPADVLFQVSKDYYFPLYKSGKDRETATTSETVSLDYKDPYNRTYKLYSAPVRECVAVKKRAKRSDGGC